MTVNFRDWKCEAVFSRYYNDRTAIQLIDEETTWPPVATATMNLPETELARDEVIVKDYSENIGMLDALMEAGIVTAPVRYVRTGYVSCPICKLISNQT